MIDLTKLVRPLVWDEGQRYGDAQSWLCFNDKGRFCYGVDLAGIFYMQTPDEEEDGFPTIEAAKAAAQADYAARIIAAMDGDALAAMLAEAEARGAARERDAVLAIVNRDLTIDPWALGWTGWTMNVADAIAAIRARGGEG